VVDVVIRRWKFTIAALVIGLAGTLVYQFWYKRVPAECGPVIELLDFNTSQTEKMNAESEGKDALSPAAEDVAFSAWADGLADRAGKVTDPTLAVHAVQVATLADQFARQLPQLRAETAARVPGAPAPPIAFEMSLLNDRLSGELAALTKVCKK
jgi:hypothetical protein